MTLCSTTTTPPHLPVELLDFILDFLHDSRGAIESCCLISKSWIPRTRNILFADVSFNSPEKLQSWKNTFPDPSTSPAWYTRSLFIMFPQVITAVDAEEGGWITAFSRVVRLKVDTEDAMVNDLVSLIPLHGFSPVVKFFHAIISCHHSSPIFDLVLSFPSLMDLSTISDCSLAFHNDAFDRESLLTQPSSRLSLIGSLSLSVRRGMHPIAPRLLTLQGGLRFRRLKLTCFYVGDFSLATKLVGSCRSTLEDLEVECSPPFDRSSVSIDLSKAVKLSGAVFSCWRDPQWITTTLRTVTRDHSNLQRVSIIPMWFLFDWDLRNVVPAELGDVLGANIYAEWLRLDRLLAQLWESHSIRLRVFYHVPSSMGGERARAYTEFLFPEVTTRDIAEFLEYKVPP